MTVTIGLTGPIACGKSTVAARLAELGATVIDADQVARAVVEPGEPALASVLAAFGSEVRRADGALDRAALGRIVFGDPAALARLEAILHPAIHVRILDGMAAARAVEAPAVVIEAIKLVESGLADLCDEVWLVTCDDDAQRQRLAARGVGPAEAAERIAAQDRIVAGAAAVAARVIDTNGPIETTATAVRLAYEAALLSAGAT